MPASREPGESPLEYRASPACWGAATALFVAGLGFAIRVSATPPERTDDLMFALAASALALGTIVLAALLVERVRLWPDAIEFRRLFRGTHMFTRSEIVGYRVLPSGHSRPISFELDGGRRPFTITLVCRRDAALDEWLWSLPNLDEVYRERVRRSLLGPAPDDPVIEARMRFLAGAHRVARVLNGAACAVGVWALIYPNPFPLVVAACLAVPAFAVVLLFVGRGSFTFRDVPTERRATMPLALFPAVVLTLRSITGLTLLDHGRLIVSTGLAALAVGCIVILGDRPLRAAPRDWVWLVGLMPFGLYGPVTLMNALLDRAPPERFEARVLGRERTTGRGVHLELTLAEWGAAPSSNTVIVPPFIYDAVHVGSTVCIYVHPGAFGARWLRVRLCQRE